MSIEWIAWSDHGGGLAKGISAPVTIKLSLYVKDLMAAVQHCIPDIPAHRSLLWSVKEGRFMHDGSRQLKTYGVKDGDVLYLLLRCTQPLVTG